LNQKRHLISTQLLSDVFPVLHNREQSALETLAKIVYAATKNDFLILAELPRFLANPRMSPYTLQCVVASFIFPNTPLPHIVAVDCTEFRGSVCLVASRVARE